MDLNRVSAALVALKAPRFRLDQVRQAVFKESAVSYDDIKVLPEAMREALKEAAPILGLSLKALSVSVDFTRKATLALSDGRVVESVLMAPSSRRWTVCVSSQAGCAIGCGFCATGMMGFSRNLTPEEITDQVLFWRQYMKRESLTGPLSNVVYMGMGEPFATYESVAESLNRLMDQRQFGIGARHISVSTSGLAPQMERFAKDFPQVNLALSLHAANDSLRSSLVPLNSAFPLFRLAAALKRYLDTTRRKVMLEYVMLQGVNDGDMNARELIDFIASVGHGGLLHVNLIVFNPTDTPYRPSTGAQARHFQNLLRHAGIPVTLRQNLGQDIQGACGQLVAQQTPHQADKKGRAVHKSLGSGTIGGRKMKETRP